jgi:hypothetical protein
VIRFASFPGSACFILTQYHRNMTKYHDLITLYYRNMTKYRGSITQYDRNMTKYRGMKTQFILQLGHFLS